MGSACEDQERGPGVPAAAGRPPLASPVDGVSRMMLAHTRLDVRMPIPDLGTTSWRPAPCPSVFLSLLR